MVEYTKLKVVIKQDRSIYICKVILTKIMSVVIWTKNG